jgi:TRAP-type uncharacterized transport system fused permease subunit
MIVLRVVTSFIAISCMAIAFQGYLSRVLGWLLRLGFLIAGLFLIYPYWVADIIGYLLLGILLLTHLMATRARRNIPPIHSPST